MPLVVGLSGLQSNFIGQNFHARGTFPGVSAIPNWQTAVSVKLIQVA